MTASEILNRVTAAGVRLRVASGRIVAAPKDAMTEDLRALIRSHKAALLEALTTTAATSRANGTGQVAPVADVAHFGQDRQQGDATGSRAALEARAPEASPAFEARRQHVLAMLAAVPGGRYAALTDAEADPDAVLLALAIRSAPDGATVTCELRIPRAKYDPWLLLELIERHGATVH